MPLMRHHLAFLILGSWLIASMCLTAANLPDGFVEKVIVENVNAGTAILILPDGRVLYAEQTGYLKMVVDEVLLSDPVLDISSRMDDFWETGFNWSYL